ncbi:MAG TPA: NADH-quinone oxidoreductase subunit N [Candidatus Kapabacteria bacterium]|nr:NADH-quinone oxidoreductase subunit N [Candidatus Kapabacteria bacterium]
MLAFQVTARDIYGVMPLLILVGTGLVVLMWDAFEKIHSRIPLFLTVLGALAAAAAGYVNLGNTGRIFNGMILNNSFANYYAILFSVSVILAVLLAERYLRDEGVLVGEFSGLILFSACGMIMLASGNDLIVTFVGLETMSIAFYVLAGLFRKRRESNEAALKYFLLGAFSTGFFLYGIALLYGTFATTNLDMITKALENPISSNVILTSPMFWMGVAMLLVGFSFKIAAFPFHQWAPDVYEGAPTVVAGFFSTAGKAGAFAALILIFNIAMGPLALDASALHKMQTILAVLALASMFYGNITALSQMNLKRMLAYSSIAHAGYMLLGAAAMTSEGAMSVTIYLTVYLLMQMGAFGVVALLEKETGRGLELSDYAGLGRTSPWLAFVMSIMMLSLTGIPPFGGFFAKYYVFTAAIRAGLTPYAILGMIATLISVYFYIRVIVVMYFREPEEGVELAITPGGAVAVVRGDTISAWAALAIAAIGLFVLGIFPMLLTNIAKTFYIP